MLLLTDDSVGGGGSAVRADTVGDEDVTAVAECLLANKAGHSWRSRRDGVAETRRRLGSLGYFATTGMI
jgi:hypothetical protein